MDELQAELDALAERTDFSGALRVTVAGAAAVELVRGDADRANGRPIRSTTRFATASVTKGFTALAVMALQAERQLELETTVASLVGDQLPLIDPTVTIDHLLTHRSGIGDYLDEELLGDIDDHVLKGRSAHTFERPADYLPLLQGHPQRTSPGAAFAYNNSGFQVLSLIVEHVSGSFHRCVEQRVFNRASMTRSGFFRSDDLPADCALGYLQSGRTNQFHLPVIGGGDGGAFATLDDMTAFWHALLDGQIVDAATVERMTTVVTNRGDDKASYGRGFWLRSDGGVVWLEGMDAGVSVETGVYQASGSQFCVLSNTSSGAWPMAKSIREHLDAHYG